MPYLIAILTLALLIAIHEFGHLAVAKRCGIPIRRFSVGFGPKLVGWRHRETEYWLSVIPLGGYVLPGVDEDELRDYAAYKRVLCALGGPMANIAAAFIGLLVLGLVERNLGASDALAFATTQLWTNLRMLISAVPSLFGNPDQMSGIVGIVTAGGSLFGSTVAGMLTFSVLININLAVLNLLPIPPLDGGRVLFCILEKVYAPFARTEASVTVVGWAFVLALMVYATVQDLGRVAAGALV